MKRHLSKDDKLAIIEAKNQPLFKNKEPPVVDISDEATTTEADASATADTNKNSITVLVGHIRRRLV